VRCEQEVAGGRDVYRLPLPAVVGVREGLNLPRYPSVPGGCEPSASRSTRGRRRARRPGWRSAPCGLPPGSGKEVQILGEGAGAAPAVVAVLDEMGLV